MISDTYCNRYFFWTLKKFLNFCTFLKISLSFNLRNFTWKVSPGMEHVNSIMLQFTKANMNNPRISSNESVVLYQSTKNKWFLSSTILSQRLVKCSSSSSPTILYVFLMKHKCSLNFLFLECWSWILCYIPNDSRRRTCPHRVYHAIAV